MYLSGVRNCVITWIEPSPHVSFKELSPVSELPLTNLTFSIQLPLIYLPSVTVTSDYLQKKVSMTRIWKCPSSPVIHISPIEVIPKKNKPALIIDLSSRGFSVSVGIYPDPSTLSYTSFDWLALQVLPLGGALLVKAEAYHIIQMISTS